jgi:hypothetical protein
VIHLPDPPEPVDALGMPLRQPEFAGTFSNAPTPPVTIESLSAAAELVEFVRRAAAADRRAFFWRTMGRRFRAKSRAWFAATERNCP